MQDIGLWGFLTICGCIALLCEAYQTRIKVRSRNEKDQARNDELLARMEKLERRMANLETIVLETEKDREFHRSL